MKVRDVERYLYELKNNLNGDEGILFGNPCQEISGIHVSWMANLAAIESAAVMGSNLMLVHEALFLPWRGEEPSKYLSWKGNYSRIKALSQNNIAVIRFHGTLDEICILDDFAGALGLPPPSVDEPFGVKLYDIEPVSIEDLVERVKNSLHMSKVRLVTPSNPPSEITRIGLPWGGLGLFVNVAYQGRLLRYGPHAFISGETDSYAMHFAADSGIYLIETGHEISENIGLKNFANRLAADLKEVPVHYFENEIPCSFR